MDVKKIRMLLTIDGLTAHYNVDFVWDGDRPVAVLEWTRGNDGRDKPAVTEGVFHDLERNVA